MGATVKFIQNNFKSISVLKSGAAGVTELVAGSGGAVYIRKRVNAAGLPYRALAQINCTGLPKIYYCAEENGATWVIEEYINGVNLQKELEQRIFGEREVLAIALQLCKVLQVLHAHNILHRDIKPANIILQNGTAWLIDFGAAKIANSAHGQDTRILGTPGYAPPEQYGFSTTDARSDIYALGKTMEALLGAGYNGRLKQVIAKCTAFDPQKRVVSAAELQKLLAKTQTNTKKCVAIAAAVLLIIGSYFYLTVPQADEVPVQQAPAVEVQPQKEAELQTKAQPQTQMKVQEQAPPQAQTTPAAAASLTAQNLEFTISTNPLYQTAREQGKAAGFTLVELPKGKWPVFTVHNSGTQELTNPQLVLTFSNMFVTGSNLTANAWGGRSISWQVVKNSSGYASQVTIRLGGTIPASDYFELPLTGAVANYYISGQPAAVKAALTADNLPQTVQTYNIKIN